MRIALAVTRVLPDTGENLRNTLTAVTEASQAGADLVLFCEAAPTGLDCCGDPGHDLPLGQAIPGPATELMADAARHHGIYVALGLFEREGDSLFDSAILLDPAGKIVLKYRRMSRGWRDPKWDASVYREGAELAHVEAPHGSVAFLICGDLFDDTLCSKVRSLGVDYVLCPMSRNYGDNSYDQSRWDREDKAEYAARAKYLGSPVIMVNQLGGTVGSETGDCFGGAMAVSRDARIVAELPIGRPGMLLVDLQC